MTLNTSINRRRFLSSSGLAVGALLTLGMFPYDIPRYPADAQGPEALKLSHFPSALHALVWRNWNLVPTKRIAKTVGASLGEIRDLAQQMGLPAEQLISESQWERSYLTVIRRNWHLLPKSQLLVLMDWTPEQLEFTLVEDDFFYIKLGSLKPKCETIDYKESLAKLDKGELAEFKRRLRAVFPAGLPVQKEPLFHFVKELSQQAEKTTDAEQQESMFSPRLAYPYFALFGDPLLSESDNSYPDAYLNKIHSKGVDSIWMHIVLSKISPFPWDEKQSKNWQKRLHNLAKLVDRAGSKGIKIFLYLNEPRNQTTEFFAKYPHLRGSGNSLCTSKIEVQQYLTESLALISERVPGLGGFFSITASENPTHCWSHSKGDQCATCGPKGPAEVIATLNNIYIDAIHSGFEKRKGQNGNIRGNNEKPKLIVWDWGWQDGIAEVVLPSLKNDSTSFMSVSEWNLPIERGGVKSQVGEYSISSIGPGPRASKHWEIAKRNNILCVAKIQANNSWEIGAVPYIPALYNVGQHVSNLRNAGVTGLMLGWSLGGYPSPNLELVDMLGKNKDMPFEKAILEVANNRFAEYGPVVAKAWRLFSTAFREFPYHVGVVYNAPLQAGPSNLLWSRETNYKSTMVGLPYDDLTSWRSIYPETVFISQLEKVCQGFAQGVDLLHNTINGKSDNDSIVQVKKELNIAESILLHYQSIINQSNFIINRRILAASNAAEVRADLRKILQSEMDIAFKLAEIQGSDSRIGFEASNQYFYVPQDLFEKVLNCSKLIDFYKV